jgi:DNA polymerase-3 subunit epsilon
MDFTVVDVETANRNPASICQIGLASFRDGNLSAVWGSLIDPEDSFSAANMAIHGIRPEDVSDAPNWVEIQGELRVHFADLTLASHTYFDFRAISNANDRYGVVQIAWRSWVDTCRVARAAWPHLYSYRLSHLAHTFGISYQAHNATEDARCAGQILLLAAQSTGLSMRELVRANTKFVSPGLLRRPR